MTQAPSTVIVTGASSGIGLAIARAFLDRGANVVVNGRDPDRLAAAFAGSPEHIAVVPGDIADPATGTALVRAAGNRFGGADVLVNNAGIFAPKPFLEVTADELERYLTVNLRGTFFTSQAFVRQLRDRDRGGSIVNLGAVLVEHGLSGFAVSAPMASKGGIHALTVSLAAELAAVGIRVNTVAPGLIRTPLLEGADLAALGGLALLGHVGEVGDVVAAVLYATDSPYVTGEVLRVDGGIVSGRR